MERVTGRGSRGASQRAGRQDARAGRQRLHPSTEFPGTGIGLANVRERLRVIYGATYQLTLTSEPGRGTSARIEIPELVAAVISEDVGPERPAPAAKLDVFYLAAPGMPRIEVTVGVREARAMELIRAWTKYITLRQTYLTLKLALSLDGRIATRTGDSQWVTGEASLKQVHALRAEHDAVMVGINTAVADDPPAAVDHLVGPHKPAAERL